METVFIRVTIPNVQLAEVVELKTAIDNLADDFEGATVELNIVRRPNMGYPMMPPQPPGG